jgi:hypothetical protein
MKYAVGDEVILDVEDDFGYSDKVHRSVKVQVIATYIDETEDDSSNEFICYVPPYSSVPGSFTINHTHVKWYGIDKKFLNDDGCIITETTPVLRHHPAPLGDHCDNCNDFVQGAERTNNDFVCRSCVQNPYR